MASSARADTPPPFAIGALPPELLIEIFKHYLPLYPARPPLIASTRASTSPTTLLGVCTSWRALALGTPVLWRAIDVDSRDAELVDTFTWLARSAWGDTRLGLSIRISARSSVPRGMTFERVLAVLLASGDDVQARVEYLDLAPDYYGPLHVPALPRLHGLDVVFFSRGQNAKVVLAGAPALREVSLHDDCYSVPVHSDSERDNGLAWGQLTQLSLHSTRLGRCLPVLQLAGSLQHCRLQLVLGFEPDANPVGVVVGNIVLPHLQTLVLGFASGRYARARIVDVLAYFCLPALRRLEVPASLLTIDTHDAAAAPSHRGSVAISRLNALLQRSGPECPVSRLRVTYAFQDEPEADRDLVFALKAAFPEPEIKVLGAAFNAKEDDAWRTEKYWEDTAAAGAGPGYGQLRLGTDDAEETDLFDDSELESD